MRTTSIFLLAGAVVACGEEAAPPVVTGSGGSDVGTSTSAAGGGGAGGQGGQPPSAVATVTILDAEGAPAEGILVFSNRADGTYFAKTTSDASGAATIAIPDPEGSMVTVFWENIYVRGGTVLTPRHFRTFMHVTEGDTVAAAVAFGAPPQAPAPMSISIEPTIVSHKYFEARTSCGGGASFTTLNQPVSPPFAYKGCPTQEPYDIYLFAHSDPGGPIVSYTYFSDQPFSPGQSVTHKIAPTKTDLQSIAVQVDDIPPGSQGAYVDVFGRRKLARGFDFKRSKSWAFPDTTTKAGAIEYPLTGPTHHAWVVGVNMGESHFERGHYVTAGLPPTSIAASAKSLAGIDLSDPDMTTIDRPLYAWSLVDGPIGGLVELWTEWSEGDATTTWTAIGPPEFTSLQVPEVPGEAAAALPTPSTTFAHVAVFHVDILDRSDDYQHIAGKTHNDWITELDIVWYRRWREL
jgi:hypothetical protein